MHTIKIELNSRAEVYANPDALFEGLKKQALNTKSLRDALEVFFTRFNEQYNSKVKIEDILDIYAQKRTASLRENIILCKALLDFIQNHALEVTFDGKMHLLKYATLANINVILEYSPASDEQRVALQTLASTISGFVTQIRQYFRAMIDDTLVSLEKANIDEYFFAIPGIRKVQDVVKVQVEQVGPQEVIPDAAEPMIVALPVSPMSVKISDSLVLPFSIGNDELRKRIQSLENEGLVALFNFIYDRIPYNERGGRKHVDIAKVVFQDYIPSHAQTIERVLNQGTKLRSDSIAQFDIERIRKIVLNPQLLVQNEVTSTIGQALTVTGNILTLREGVTINLENDQSIIESIIELEAEDVQTFFGFLEDLTRKRLQISGTVARELAVMIQSSDDKMMNIYQKVTNLRREPARIFRKFFENNINITALKNLILGIEAQEQEVGVAVLEPQSPLTDEGRGEVQTTGKEKSKEKIIFDFTFQADDKIIITYSIESLKGKTKEAFISALNSLVRQECKRLDVEGYIEDFTGADFQDIEFDSGFFATIQNERSETPLATIFEVLSEDVLEEFLKAWHLSVQMKLKETKKVYVEPGSREELFDFVHNVWQEKLNAIVRKEIRKSGTSRAGHVEKRKKTSTLSEEMFAGFDKLTPDLIQRLPAHTFQQIFSRTSKKEVEGWLKDYLDARKKK